MADTGINFDFKPLQQYSERLAQLDKYAKQLDKTLDGLQAKQSILDKRFTEGAKTTQRMVDAFNKHDRAAIASLRSSEKLEEAFSKAPASVKKFEDSLKRTKEALEQVKASTDKVDLGTVVDKFEDAGTKSATGFGTNFKAVFERLNVSGIARNVGTKLQDGFKRVLPDIVRRSGDILVKGFQNIASQVSRTFITGLQGMGNAAVGVVQGIKNNITSAFQGIGQALAVGGLVGGLSIGAIAGSAFNTTVEFDRAIINTQAATQQTNEEIAILRENLLEIGGDSRVGVEATANAFYDVASAVSDVNLQIPILESSILLAESGSDPVNELATATDGLVNVFNAYGLSADQAGRVSDTFARSVQLGKGSLTEFVDAISSVAVVGSNANVSFEELGASIAFITARGASASEAATQLERATTALLRPNADLQVLLNQIGFESGSAALESLGLAGTLQALFDATGGNVDQFARALGSVEAFQAGLALADDSFNEFQANFDAGLDGATLRSAEVQANSIAAKLDLLRAAFGRVQVILADTLLPVILPVVAAFTDFLQTIAQNNPELIQFAAILGIVAISLPVIGAAFGLILNPVGLLAAAVIGLSAAFADFSETVPLLQEAAGLVQDIGSALGFGGDTPTDAPTDVPATNTNGSKTATNSSALLQQETRLLNTTYRRLGAEEEIASIREESAVQTLDYTVEAGDTLSQIALDYGVSIEDLLAANPEITDPNLILAGQTLTIPGELELDVNTKSAERTLSKTQEELNSFTDGLRTSLDDETASKQQSRVDIIRDAIDELKGSLAEIFTITSQELGEGLSDFLKGLQLLSSGDVSGGLVIIKDALLGMVNTVLGAGKDFGLAIIDFLGAVLGIDTSEAEAVFSSFFDPLMAFVDGVKGATTEEFKQLGTGIERIANAAALLQQGQVGDALSELAGGITDIKGGLTGIGFEVIDQLLLTIENVTGVDTEGLRNTISDVRNIFDGLSSAFNTFASPILKAAGESLTNDILPGLSSLGTGLDTFLGQVGDLAVGESLQTISDFFGKLFGLGVVFFGSFLGSTLESLGENLPLVGQGITDLVDGIAALLRGDIVGGLTKLGGALGNVWSAIVGFSQDATINFLQAVEAVTGLDTSGLQQTAREIELILKNPLVAVQQFIHQLGEELTRFAVDIQVKLIEAVLAIPGIDQLAGFDLEGAQSRLVQLQDVQFEIEAARGIETAIASSILEDGVITLEDLGPLIQLELANADVVAHIDPMTIANVRDATQDALVAGTTEDALSNLVISNAIGIDISDQNFIISDERKAELQGLLVSEIQSILATAPEDLSTEQLIELDNLIDVSGELNLDLTELGLDTAITDFQAALDAQLALGEDGALSLSVEDLLNTGELDFSQAIADMEQAGTDVATGFANGIEGSGSFGADAAATMGEDAVDSTAQAVGSNSPALEFVAIGQFIAQGLALGITTGFPAVQAAMGLIRTEIRATGQEGVTNINALTLAYNQFANVVQSTSTRIQAALSAVVKSLIDFGSAAAGLALSVSITENALVGAGPDPNYDGGIVEFATGGVLQTLSAPGKSEHALYRAGSAMQSVDHSAAYALVGERGREIASTDLSLFGRLNNNPSAAFDFGYQQALNPTANISFVGTHGPELLRTNQSVAILRNSATEAYIKGYRMALQGYQSGGVIHADIPRFADGGFASPSTFASLSGAGGVIINEDNSMVVTINIDGSQISDADELADTVVGRIEESMDTETRRKKGRLGRQL